MIAIVKKEFYDKNINVVFKIGDELQVGEETLTSYHIMKFVRLRGKYERN